MKSKITGKEVSQIFEATLLGKYKVKYYHDTETNFIQPEEPYWLEEAYNSPINRTDVGLLGRIFNPGHQAAVTLFMLFNTDSKFLDFAGGYGIYTRYMRDLGFDFYWDDIYTQNLLARGFEHQKGDKYKALTAFETFEHLPDPMNEIDNMFKFTDTLVFSTTLLPNPIPKPEDWWYYGLEHGQHIALYSKETFEYIAKVKNLKFYTGDGQLHMLTKEDIVPTRIVAEFLEKRSTASAKSELLKFYKKEPSKYSDAIKLKDRTKNRLLRAYEKYKGQEYYVLTKDLTSDEKAKVYELLNENGMLKQYINYLLSPTSGTHLTKIKNTLESRTIPDYNLIKDRIMSQITKLK